MPKIQITQNGDALFDCPGCGMLHVDYLKTPGRPHWTFNGDVDRPTFSPSIAVHWTEHPLTNPVNKVCHSFVTEARSSSAATARTNLLDGRSIFRRWKREPIPHHRNHRRRTRHRHRWRRAAHGRCHQACHGAGRARARQRDQCAEASGRVRCGRQRGARSDGKTEGSGDANRGARHATQSGEGLP